MTSGINQYHGDRDEHAAGLGSIDGIPVHTVHTILSERTHESVKDFDHSNQDVQFDHGLSANPMIEFTDTNGRQNILIDTIQDEYLNHLICVPAVKLIRRLDGFSFPRAQANNQEQYTPNEPDGENGKGIQKGIDANGKSKGHDTFDFAGYFDKFFHL